MQNSHRLNKHSQSWGGGGGTFSPAKHNRLHQGQNKLQSVSYLLCKQVIKPLILNHTHTHTHTHTHKHTQTPTHKISPDTNLHKTYTNIKHKIFEELIPSVLPLLKKYTRLGHAGIVDNSIDLSLPDFKKFKRNGQIQ